MIDVSVQKTNEKTDKSSLSLISCDKWYTLKWLCVSLMTDLYQKSQNVGLWKQNYFHVIPTINAYRKSDMPKSLTFNDI